MSRNILRFITCLIVAIAVAAPCATRAQGNCSVGLRGGYTTANEAPIAGLGFQYRFVKYFRLSAAIDYYFRHQGVDAFAMNIDGHVPFAVSSRVNIYPLAGFSLTSRNVKISDPTGDDDSSNRNNRFGINAGGGAEYYVTPHLRLAVEAKYAYVKDFDGGVFTASIGYVF